MVECPCSSLLHYCTPALCLPCTPIWPLFCNTLHVKAKPKIKRFEDLIVWQKALCLSRKIYQRTNEGAFAKDWGLRDQVRRASVSILSNIAEGFGRYSTPEFRKYLAIANGSSYEVRAQCHLARELGYLSKDEAERFIGLSVEISKMIRALRRKTGK